ncbi:MAG: hypothetical protein ACPG8W_13410 [Candidatus Promineifilaceae bacterium]
MTNIESISQQLDTVGIIALVPGELPHNRVIEIADALLAAPILAVQIVPNGNSTLDTLQAFRQRAGDNMLVGADRVESLAELQAVIDAGAQFASTSGEFEIKMIGHGKKNDFMFIPTVHSPGQTLMSSKVGCQWQKIRDDIDVEGLEGMMERNHAIGFRPKYIINQIALENIDAAYDAGARLTCVNDIYLGPDQPMHDIITRAREARQIWLDSRAESAE